MHLSSFEGLYFNLHMNLIYLIFVALPEMNIPSSQISLNYHSTRRESSNQEMPSLVLSHSMIILSPLPWAPCTTQQRGHITPMSTGTTVVLLFEDLFTLSKFHLTVLYTYDLYNFHYLRSAHNYCSLF